MPTLIHCPLLTFMSFWGVEEFAVFYPEAKVGLIFPHPGRGASRGE
jgi:hypothetical protein